MNRVENAPIPRVDPGVSKDGVHLMTHLGQIAQSHGMATLAGKLARLASTVRDEMRMMEAEFASLPERPSSVGSSAMHLWSMGGKRLRPLCVLLAARCGTGYSDKVRDLALAVELVHNATLLHDDVVDLGDVRRDQPTARTIYGNAASIFAGDWLLIEALRRVRQTGVAPAFERLLDVIEQMIFAESEQLESRGRVQPDMARWQRVVEGKTAALFRWAMFAGGCAAGLSAAQVTALEQFGLHLGVGFQAVDDLLDFGGFHTGKSLYADLREGKMTYPLIVATERDASFTALLQEIVAWGNVSAPPRPHGDANEVALPPHLSDAVQERLNQTGALVACRALAQKSAESAIRCLDALPASSARDDLETVVLAVASREA